MLSWDEDVTPAPTPVRVPQPALAPVTSSQLNQHVSNVALDPALVSTPAAAGEGASRRVNAADKRIINGKTDVNQLVPFTYKWAWDK